MFGGREGGIYDVEVVEVVMVHTFVVVVVEQVIDCRRGHSRIAYRQRWSGGVGGDQPSIVGGDHVMLSAS